MIFAKKLIELALLEDIGLGDVTTELTVPEYLSAVADFRTRVPMVVCGTKLIAEVFAQVDPHVQVELNKKDGSYIEAGEILATISGPAKSILQGERLALNFMRRLSGISSFTKKCVDEVKTTKIKICDTRKTTPGWRYLEKYAVRCGGGHNHRASLADTVMIKDNHIVSVGGIEKTIELALKEKPQTSKIQVEVDTIEQLQKVVKYPIELVLLDNMSPKQVESALKIIPKSILSEVSGGMTLEKLKNYKHLAIDRISMGCLTADSHSADIGLDFRLVKKQ